MPRVPTFIMQPATIDSINILSRNLAEKGKDNGWMRRIVPGGRIAYAKFAISLAADYYLSQLREEDTHEENTAH